MHKQAKIYVAGHHGLVGSALHNALQAQGYTNIITRTSKELDLRNQQAVTDFFSQELPQYVFLAAAKVGGIYANNTYPAQFLYDNVMIEANVLHAAYVYGVTKLLFLGSSCIYPRECAQPINESYLLSGPLEHTNKPYALAKITGIALCESYNKQYGTHFISCMPTNLYGPRDNFDLETSHVIPALIAKICKAQHEQHKTVTVWGTGNALREFLYVEDLANALIFLMHNYDENLHINIGTGKDMSIKNLALLIKKLTGYQGELIFDTSKPDGTPRKVLNVEKINNLGWHAATRLEDGLKKTIDWYVAEHYKKASQTIPLCTSIDSSMLHF
ncbi:MAG: GDP-L-fucose synthase family protein [Candidatus Babeliales bacterium]